MYHHANHIAKNWNTPYPRDFPKSASRRLLTKSMEIGFATEVISAARRYSLPLVPGSDGRQRWTRGFCISPDRTTTAKTRAPIRGDRNRCESGLPCRAHGQQCRPEKRMNEWVLAIQELREQDPAFSPPIFPAPDFDARSVTEFFVITQSCPRFCAQLGSTPKFPKPRFG